MKKISGSQSEKLLITYVIKTVVMTLLCVLILGLAFSELLLKLDVSLDYLPIMSVFICAFSAFLVSVAAVRGMRNNGLLMGVLSGLPLILYSLFNAVFNENTFLYFAIKLALILVFSALGGVLSAKRSGRIKV